MTKRKAGAPIGNTNAAKPDDERVIHVHITLYPPQLKHLDALTNGKSRSEVIRDILDKLRNSQQCNDIL